MNQITHDNHYVPRVYLRQWSDDGTHIWAYRILVPHEKSRRWIKYSIRRVAYQRDLYTEIIDGKDVDDFEKRLAKEFEEPVQEIIQKVLQGKSLTTSDWVCLARYVGSQDVRTPLSYLESIDRWNKDIPKILHQTLDEIKTFKSNEKMVLQPETEYSKKFKKAVKVEVGHSDETEVDQAFIKTEVTLGRSLWLAQMNWLLTNTIKVLETHKWSIIQPASGYYWFTTDHPVVRLSYVNENNYDLRGGWGKEKCNILMPLSPQHLLFTQIGDEFKDHFSASREKTEEFQKFIAARSFRWIFAHKPLNEVCALRPRNVDANAYNHEIEQWKKWHELQNQQ